MLGCPPGWKIPNPYRQPCPVPMKRVTIFETPVWRKTSPLGTCTHVPWCGDPMVCDGHLLLEITDASLRLIASDSVMTLMWLLYFLSTVIAVVSELSLLNFTHVWLFHLKKSTENVHKKIFAAFCICSRTTKSENKDTQLRYLKAL